MKYEKYIGFLIMVCALVSAVYVGLSTQTPVALGNVAAGDGCFATSTPGIPAAVINGAILLNRAGILCSVIITGPNAGELYLYDATTSDATLRSFSTSTLPLIAAITKSNTASSTLNLPYNIQLRYGLLLVGSPTNMPTTTITFK